MLDEDQLPPTNHQADNSGRARGWGSSNASIRVGWECWTVERRIILDRNLADDLRLGGAVRPGTFFAWADDARLEERFRDARVYNIEDKILRAFHEFGPAREVHG